MRPFIGAALVAAGASLIPSISDARPVTYPGGKMGMVEYRDESTMVETMLTLTPNLSVGWHDEWDVESNWQFHGPMVAGLARRWNMPNAQANIFWMAGVGVAYDDANSLGGDAEPAGYVGIEADWENRRFYTLYQARAFWAEDIDQTFSQRLRVGVAPYIAEAGELHTWAILQIDHEPEDDNPISISPVIRMFRDTTLVEAGVSLDGDAFASVMFYF